MAQRYGASTLQLKNLSDLSNIGSPHTNIFSATGKQVLSGVGSGSFSYSARDNTLHTAVKAADGQVAYIYQTDAVASGAAMDVCCIIIDSRNITTSEDGATVTVSGQDILDQLTYTNAGTGAIDNGSGGPSTTDLDDIMTFSAAGWGYTATGTGGATRSSTGSYHATKGDNVMQLLIATTKRSGDIFRLSSYSPPAKTVAWRASADSSGVTLRMPTDPTTYDGSTTTGIILSMTEDTDTSERITGVRPYGAGIGDGRLDITGIDSGDTGGDPSGYSTTFASNVIVNTTLETALGYTKRLDVDFSDIGVEDGTNATQLTSAAVDLWREAINFLQERDGAKTFYRLRCIVAYNLRPGQTVAVNYTEYEGGTTGGSAVWTVNSSFTIHEVTNSVGQDGLRYTDLLIANTIKKRATPDRVMAEAVRKTQATTRKSDVGTSPGSVSTGRTLNATLPLRIDGGASADLSADRTHSVLGLSTIGGANQVPGTNAGATAWEYKTVTAGTGISVGHTAGAITITNTSPGSGDISGLAYVTIGNTGSLSAERALTAGDGLDLTDGGANSTVTLAVDVTDFIDTSFGLTESSNNIRVNLAATSGLSFSTGALQLDDSVAGAGLAIASKVLAVGAGDGIDVAADSIAVDVTDIIGNGLTETSNNIVLGTPGTLTATSTNGVTTTSHTHEIDSTIARTSQLHTQSHVLATTTALGPDHTVSGLTAGFTLVATGSTTARFQQLAHSNLSGVGANDHHNQSHVLASTSGLGADHTVSGLTSRQVLIATGSTTALFRALQAGDLPTGDTLSVSSTNSGNSHAITSSSAVSSSTAVILATDSNGRTRVQGLAIGESSTQNALQITKNSGSPAMIVTAKSNGELATPDGEAIRFGHWNSGSSTFTERLQIDSNGALLLGITATGANLTTGLVVDQGGNDDNIAEFRSAGDVAHGMTTVADTSVYGQIRKTYPTNGGVRLYGLSDSAIGVQVWGYAATDTTTKATTSDGYVEIRARKKSGTGSTDPGSNANLLTIKANNTTRWIVDAEGDTHRDGSDSSYDVWDDAHLARAFDRTVSPGAVIDSEFDDWVQYGRDDLVKAGILHESGFYNESRLLRLAVGAVWQEYTERQRLALRVQELERRLLN